MVGSSFSLAVEILMQNYIMRLLTACKFRVQVDDTLSVYLEYVSGGSIHKLLQEYGPFGEPVIRSYARQILSGLAYLHGRNTVHRYPLLYFSCALLEECL